MGGYLLFSGAHRERCRVLLGQVAQTKQRSTLITHASQMNNSSHHRSQSMAEHHRPERVTPNPDDLAPKVTNHSVPTHTALFSGFLGKGLSHEWSPPCEAGSFKLSVCPPCWRLIASCYKASTAVASLVIKFIFFHRLV